MEIKYILHDFHLKDGSGVRFTTREALTSFTLYDAYHSFASHA